MVAKVMIKISGEEWYVDTWICTDATVQRF